MARGQTSGYQSTTFVIGTPVEVLSVQRAQEMLERVAVAAYFTRHDITYFRVRFEGNGKPSPTGMRSLKQASL